ncbi:MAG: DUF4157 domain-containing protein [Eubacteriales bacterium]|nr:DUF4157 domain-containing protein [Eubacteriales bacterium]
MENQQYIFRNRAKADRQQEARPSATGTQSLSNSMAITRLGMQADDTGKTQLWNTMLQRMPGMQAQLNKQIPSAENEADALAASINAHTPEAVKQAMGDKLSADFSGVRFHTDAAAASKAEAIGARAFTSGSDVYFDSDGFDGSVAAHELVHTAQQGVVDAGAMVGESAPMGGVQMLPKMKDIKSSLGKWGKSAKSEAGRIIGNVPLAISGGIYKAMGHDFYKENGLNGPSSVAPAKPPHPQTNLSVPNSVAPAKPPHPQTNLSGSSSIVPAKPPHPQVSLNNQQTLDQRQQVYKEFEMAEPSNNTANTNQNYSAPPHRQQYAPKSTSNWQGGESPAASVLAQIQANEQQTPQQHQQIVNEQTQRFYHWANSHKGLNQSPDQQQFSGANGVRKYSDNRNYQIMNQIARTGNAPANVNGTPVTAQEAKDMALANSEISNNLNTGAYTRLESNVVVHRGGTEGYGDALRKQLPNPAAAKGNGLTPALSGNVFSDPAFTSTTLNPDVADQFSEITDQTPYEHNVLHAVLPKGLKAQYISPVSQYQGEEEMLLDRNSPFRVINAQDKVKQVGNQSVPYRNINGAYLRGLSSGHRVRKP